MGTAREGYLKTNISALLTCPDLKYPCALNLYFVPAQKLFICNCLWQGLLEYKVSTPQPQLILKRSVLMHLYHTCISYVTCLRKASKHQSIEVFKMIVEGYLKQLMGE